MILLIILGGVVAALAAYGLFVLTSVERFAKQWDAQNQQAVDASSVVLVALGDSTVQGIGATSTYKGFVGQLTKKVSADQDQPVQVYNFSKSGAVAKYVLEQQLANDKLSQADVILIAVGSNDITRSVNKEEYLQNYQKVLNALPRDKVVIATIPPLVRSQINDDRVNEWNDGLRQLAAKNKVKVADVYRAIKPREYDPRIYSIDLFHPSNIGYGLWAEAFYPPVTEILSAR